MMHPWRIHHIARTSLLGMGFVRAVFAASTVALFPPAINTSPITNGLSARAALGKTLFFDASLSASGKQSCASCHAANQAFTPANSLAVQLGGAALDLPGPRSTPSLVYALFTPPFTTTPAPTGQPARRNGGFLHDGRANSLAIQAQLPFTAPFEMANKSAAEVTQRLSQRPYLAQFTREFGTATLNNPDNTLAAMGQAIAAWEVEDPVFKPFTSKFDASTRGQATLTPQEANGLRVFTDRTKGNCASCHSANGVNGQAALFTNHSYHNLGVPRNWDIAYNRDGSALPSYIGVNGSNLGAPNHQYYDLGLCGPFRTDLTRETVLCGQFKVPTLRNVALKQRYFHNGVFTDLNEVVGFYATRDQNPGRWYRQRDGSPDQRYNDLPAVYAANVQRGNPFAPANAVPVLSPSDVQDVVSFLCTLTDGFDPRNPAAYRNGAQCGLLR